MKYLVTIGTFDGVHRGHAKLMRWVRARARRLEMRTRVVLFAEPPRFHFRPELRLPLLTTAPERRRMIEGLGVDRVAVLRFGPRWARMAHTRFFEEYVRGRWRAGGLLVGRDFACGKGRKGDIPYLAQACAGRGMDFGVLPLVRVGGRKISSSRIRQSLSRGDAAGAARLLGRPHAVEGKVVRGRGLGRSIGVPTANVAFPAGILVPRGVYRVRVSGAGLGRSRLAVCNVGTRPTVSRSGRKRMEARVSLEVHIPGFSGSLYGRRLKVEFLRRIRAERRFSSIEALKRRIARDIHTLD